MERLSGRVPTLWLPRGVGNSVETSVSPLSRKNEQRGSVQSFFRFLSFSFPSKWEQAVERAIREVSSPHQSCLPCSALRAKMSSATTHNLTNNILTARPSKNSNSQGTKDASCTTPSWIRFQSDGRISDDMVKEDDLTTPPRAQS